MKIRSTKEWREGLRAEGRSLESLTVDEVAECILIMREEIYRNKLVAYPLHMVHMVDLAWALSSPAARKAWESRGPLFGFATPPPDGDNDPFVKEEGA